MTDVQALHTLLEQATAARDGAQGTHRALLGAAEAARLQAEQLAAYRREYAQRFDERFRSSGAIDLLQCYQAFMARLDEAVLQQERALAQAEARAEEAKRALLAAEMRVASLRKLIERRAAEAAARGERREQKASDEFASRAAWQRLAAAGADGLVLGAV